jgi:1-phosphatidylinositol phosphodiesterase
MMLYRRPNTASFMSNLPDETSIADLSLPGTHDTCAFYGGMSLRLWVVV